jgi:putative aldouronate transport system substrate-binding protein
MKTNKLRSALLAGLLGLTLAANLSARGRDQGGSGSIPVVSLYTYMGLKGIQEGTYWSKIVEEDLGIKVEVTQYTGEHLMTTMASGQIPADIFCVQVPSYVDTAIRAGMLYNLDDARAKLPNLYANFAASLQYYRDNVNGGTTGAYAFATGVTKTPPTVGNMGGPYIRWDYYKELGYPEINELEDYLPILKQMQDAHPVNADGQRQYGLSSFPSWDGGYAAQPMYVGFWIYGKKEGGGFLEIDGVSPAAGTVLDDDSAYKRAVKFYFRANQLGIFDPAAASQNADDYFSKITAGRIFFHPTGWSQETFNIAENTSRTIGYKLLPPRNAKFVNTGVNYIGGDWSWSVVKNSKNLDKALAFIDYWCSYDGMWTFWNGRQGERWDLDANGEPYYTKYGWDIKMGTADLLPTEMYGAGWAGAQPLESRVVHPGYKRQFNGDDWIPKPEITGPTLTALDADWQRVMGATSNVDLYNKRNMIVNAALAPLPPVPDNIQSINARVGDVIKTMSWQAILAKDEAEFESIWRNMVNEAKGRGFDQSVQWYREAWTQALATGTRYMY